MQLARLFLESSLEIPALNQGKAVESASVDVTRHSHKLS